MWTFSRLGIQSPSHFQAFSVLRQFFHMARRASLHDPTTVINYLEEDGGVILTDFTTIDDLEMVSADAAPYIDAILKDVSPH